MTELMDPRNLFDPEPVRAEEVMRREVLTVDARTPVTDVWGVMRAHGAEHAVVLERGACLGVVALSQLWVAWSLELAPLAPRTVLALVTPTPCVTSDTELPELCRVLLESRNGAALVRDETGELLGLVTTGDILALLARAGEPPC